MEDAVSEARQFLNDRYAALLEGDSRALTINPPLDAGEAEDFLRGLRSCLFSVDLDGYIQSEVLTLPRSLDQSKDEKSGSVTSLTCTNT